ncbi:MAG: 50S ribosomal protein L9 [Flavobacteriales bacterium]|nr:50S ribosomal protein L9 [Flavobacteriales bacterium]
MKVILKDDVANLGYRNDVVEVKNGYGRNYLIPRGLAVIATPSSIKVVEEEIRQTQRKQQQIQAAAQEMADNLNGTTLTIGTKAGSNGKIFGSVTTIQIAQALKDGGYDIDRKKISLKNDIKELGDYSAQVNLHRNVSVEIALKVVSE